MGMDIISLYLRGEKVLANDRVQYIDDICDPDPRRLTDDLLKGSPEFPQHILPQRLPRCA